MMTLISCYLLNAPIKLIALKFKNWSFKDNMFRYLLIVSALVFLLFFQFSGIPLAIIGYVVLSVISNK